MTIVRKNTLVVRMEPGRSVMENFHVTNEHHARSKTEIEDVTVMMVTREMVK